MAQMRLTTDGELVRIPTDEWLALRDKLYVVPRTELGRRTPYLYILRHWVKPATFSIESSRANQKPGHIVSTT